MDLAPDFDEFMGSLTAHGVEFIIVGASALAFHGAPRFTGVLDILVRPTLDNAARLLRTSAEMAGRCFGMSQAVRVLAGWADILFFVARTSNDIPNEGSACSSSFSRG